jgi:hypothetical protein
MGIFEAGMRKLTQDQVLVATQRMAAFKHKPPQMPSLLC